MYQKCPVCNGGGRNFNNINSFNSFICKVCNGHGIISELTGKPPVDEVKKVRLDLSGGQIFSYNINSTVDIPKPDPKTYSTEIKLKSLTDTEEQIISMLISGTKSGEIKWSCINQSERQPYKNYTAKYKDHNFELHLKTAWIILKTDDCEISTEHTKSFTNRILLLELYDLAYDSAWMEEGKENENTE